MTCVIQIIGWANGQRCNASGQYVKSIDVQKAPLTEEWLITTHDIEQAYRWQDVKAVIKVYREVLKSEPVRIDGKPNRPFTALTIEIVPIVETNGDGTWKSGKFR